mmetsp:Transcript_6963/g.15895  ORF Transcript_6963/g.15895 Transcript_6963/m.15895 type:complete len:241 (-) Transcript_6963:195-917(-)
MSRGKRSYSSTRGSRCPALPCCGTPVWSCLRARCPARASCATCTPAGRLRGLRRLPSAMPATCRSSTPRPPPAGSGWTPSALRSARRTSAWTGNCAGTSCARTMVPCAPFRWSATRASTRSARSSARPMGTSGALARRSWARRGMRCWCRTWPQTRRRRHTSGDGGPTSSTAVRTRASCCACWRCCTPLLAGFVSCWDCRMGAMPASSGTRRPVTKTRHGIRATFLSRTATLMLRIHSHF